MPSPINLISQKTTMTLFFDQKCAASTRRTWLQGLLVAASLAGCGGGTDVTAAMGDPMATADKTTNPKASGPGKGNTTTTTTSTAFSTTGTASPEPTTTVATTTATPTPTPVTTSNTVAVAKEAFSCATGAITCVEVASSGSELQASVPVTFGQPFKAGAWKHQQTGLVARDNQGQSIPLQVSDISSHRDGSTRFAVLNTQVSNLQAGERRVISLFPGTPSNLAPTLPSDPAWNMELQAKVYSPQVTKVTFGNRSGTIAGTPFVQGETVTLRLSGLANETYSLTITDKMAGGGHTTLTPIAEAFMALINAGSPIYKAEKPLGSYESLYIKARNPGHGAFTAGFTYSGLAQIAQVDMSGFKAPEIWEVKGQALLKTAVAKANALQVDANRRFHGPIATEFHLLAPFKNANTGAEHAFLTARMDTRLFESGNRIRTDVVLENNWTFKANPRNIVYELTIKQNGQVVHHQPAFEHFHHARWHKVTWTQQPKMVLRHHMRDFMDSRAVWNYDLNITVPEKVLANEASVLASRRAAQAALGPMGHSLLQPAMGTTGGRPEIGPLPRWTAMYLVSQDQRAYESMMAVADSAAAAPIHYRDETTDHPIDTIKYPGLSVYAPSTLVPHSIDPTIWAPDTAHQASFTYVPYLLTGDRFYLDEAMFWSTWNVFSLPAAYRYGELSLLHRHQVRGQAWAIRAVGETFRMLPDSHLMKPYFSKILDNNLSWYKDFYTASNLNSPMGAVIYGGQTGPWQNDFLGIVIALLAENQDLNALAVHEKLSQFNVGRFMSDAEGFCAAKAPGYYWKIANPDGSYFTKWGELFAANYPTEIGKPCDALTITDGYPTTAGGYAAYARGMLGAASNAGFATGRPAYEKWKSMTPAMTADFSNDPTWAIVPR